MNFIEKFRTKLYEWKRGKKVGGGVNEINAFQDSQMKYLYGKKFQRKRIHYSSGWTESSQIHFNDQAKGICSDSCCPYYDNSNRRIWWWIFGLKWRNQKDVTRIIIIIIIDAMKILIFANTLFFSHALGRSAERSGSWFRQTTWMRFPSVGKRYKIISIEFAYYIETITFAESLSLPICLYLSHPPRSFLLLFRENWGKRNDKMKIEYRIPRTTSSMDFRNRSSFSFPARTSSLHCIVGQV